MVNDKNMDALIDKDKSAKSLEKAADDILETEDYATFDMGSLDKVYGGLDGEVNNYLESDEYSDMSDGGDVDENEDIDIGNPPGKEYCQYTPKQGICPIKSFLRKAILPDDSYLSKVWDLSRTTICKYIDLSE